MVYGLLRTSDAVTTSSGVPVTLIVTLVVYGVLTGIVIFVPWLMGKRWRAQDPQPPAGDDQAPHGPVPAQAKQPVG